MNLEELNLSVRAYVCLKKAGIDTVEQLRRLRIDDLFHIERLNESCVQNIFECLFHEDPLCKPEGSST